jgi:hypothetical protein
MRLGFNPREYANRSKSSKPKSKYKPVPEGFYNVECIEVSIVVSKGGKKMIRAVFEILDPPIENANHLWEYFVREPAGSDGVAVADERLARWAIAAGKPDAEDTNELEHTRCRVKLVIKPGTDDYDPSNEIKFFVAPKDEPEQPAKDELADNIPY